MKCVKVPLKQLNDTRIQLMEKGLMNMEYRIKASDDYGYIPINEDIDGYEIVDIDLEPMKKVPHNFSEILKDELSAGDGRYKGEILFGLAAIQGPANVAEDHRGVLRADALQSPAQLVHVALPGAAEDVHGLVRAEGQVQVADCIKGHTLLL